MKKNLKYSLSILFILFLTSCGGGGGSSSETTVEGPKEQIIIKEPTNPEEDTEDSYSFILTAKIKSIEYHDSSKFNLKSVEYEFEVKDFPPDNDYTIKLFINIGSSYVFFSTFYNTYDSISISCIQSTFAYWVKVDIYDKDRGFLLTRELDISGMTIAEETIVETSSKR